MRDPIDLFLARCMIIVAALAVLTAVGWFMLEASSA